MTGQALYCSTCGTLRVGGELDQDDVYRFAYEHPEDRGHKPRLIPLEEAKAILIEQRKGKGGSPDAEPCSQTNQGGGGSS